MTISTLRLVKRLPDQLTRSAMGGLDTVRSGKREFYISINEMGPGDNRLGRVIVDDADGVPHVDADVSQVGINSMTGIRGFVSAFSGTLVLLIYGPAEGSRRSRYVVDTGLPLAPPEWKTPSAFPPDLPARVEQDARSWVDDR